MTYGIAGLAHGFNQGLQQRRDTQRQDQQDAMAQERHNLGMEAGQANLRGAEQAYGIQGDQHQVWQQDRARDVDQQQFNDRWNREWQKYEMTGDPAGIAGLASETLFDGVPAQAGKGEQGYEIILGDQQFNVDPAEFAAWARSMVDPGARTQYRQAVQAEAAKQSQDDLDHRRKLEIEQTKGQYGIDRSMIGRMAPGSVGIGEEGGFTFREDQGGMAGGGQPTAKMREVVALAAAQGIPEAEAWDRILNASGRPPEQAIPDIAKLLMDADRSLRRDPDAAFERAREMYLEFRSMQTGQYGVGGDVSQETEQPENAAGPDGSSPETAIPVEQLMSQPPDGTFVTRNGVLFQFRNGQPERVQ